MVQLSQTAAELLNEARQSQGVPEHFGVRVFGEATGDGGTAIRLAFTEGPEEGDEVAEQQGTQVFLPTILQSRCRML